jgi:hypothetical protein
MKVEWNTKQERTSFLFSLNFCNNSLNLRQVKVLQGPPNQSDRRLEVIKNKCLPSLFHSSP